MSQFTKPENAPDGPAVATRHVFAIKLEHLSMALAAHKLRRHTRGRTCQLGAFTPAPLFEIDCRERHRAALSAELRRWGPCGPRLRPLDRGGIALLYERVKLEHGRQEVVRTWGTGIRALRTEPRYVLGGGRDEA